MASLLLRDSVARIYQTVILRRIFLSIVKNFNFNRYFLRFNINILHVKFLGSNNGTNFGKMAGILAVLFLNRMFGLIMNSKILD